MTTRELYDIISIDESYRIERTISTSNMDKFQEAICAFANDMPGKRQKGYLLIGVHDDGRISGLKVDDALMKKISGIRSDGNILPLPVMITVFLAKVRDAETLEANNIRQQLFDNLQPNLQPNLQDELQDINDRFKTLIISVDVYLLGVKELLLRYLSCNLSCNHLATLSRQAFSKSVLKPAIDQGYVKMLYPDKPNHRGQKYQLTEKGLTILKKLIEK